MLRPARLPRLLLALLLAAAGLVLAPPAVAACTCDGDRSMRQQARAADVVFRGTLTEQQVEGQLRTYALEVERIYRGRVAGTPATVESPRRPGECGLGPLEADRAYVVFATGSGTTLRSTRCDGTGAATPRLVNRVERVLGEGNPLPEPGGREGEPPEVTYTRVADGTPPALSRLAAPGAAAVLVGLLGLLVFRRRG